MAGGPVGKPKKGGLVRGLGLGCGGLIVLFILLGVVGNLMMTPKQRAEMQKQAAAEQAASKVADKTKADAAFKWLSDMGAALPAVADLKEARVTPPCTPAPTSFDGAPYLAVDYGWFQHFKDGGFVPGKPESDPPWYRDTDFTNIQESAVPSAGMPQPDYQALAGNADNVDYAPYIAVFAPLEERLPAIGADGKTLEPGLFHGWVILIDGKTKKPIGETELSAVSSDEIKTFQLGVRKEMILGDNLKTAVRKDFLSHFWQAANESVGRICSREGARFAAHDPGLSRPHT